MNTLKGPMFVFLVMGFVVIPPLVCAQEAEPSEQEAMYYRYLEFASYVKGGNVDPHWMADGSSFWYAEGGPANTVIYKVDLKANTKTPLFDTMRLRKALIPSLGHALPNQGVPFDEFTFLDREKAVKFAVEDKEFVLQLDTYTIVQTPVRTGQEPVETVPRPGELRSPDGQRFAIVKDRNLWLRSATGGDSLQVTADAESDYEWIVQPDVWTMGEFWTGSGARWSPDGAKLALKKVDGRHVERLPVVRFLPARVEMEWVRFPRAGKPIFQTELFVLDVQSQTLVRLDTGYERDHQFEIIGWRPGGSEVLFLRMNRRRTKLELMAADPVSGSTRTILTETRDTFVVGADPDYHRKLLTLLQDSAQFIWRSERDGWSHLYLYGFDGTPIRRLTRGSFPVLGVVAVDERAGWVYFTAHAEERLYDTHLYRVTLDGTEFTQLTEATGQHDIKFSPSKEFFLDAHSSVERPPAVELRRADGQLVRTLSDANIDALKELRWSPPEEFVVKAADQETDLWGVLYKPYDFDQTKKYPVVEYIYAGPQVSIRTYLSSFTAWPWLRAVAQLGFIVFVVDGRGTPERGKEFQDVVYGNVGRHEIPDHVAALKHLAEHRPYMDLSRVGIVGGSFGGYAVLRAMLSAPEVYHVGVADSPDVDFFHDDYFFFEPYLGLPEENPTAYEYGSNLRLVGSLVGKLLLIVGTGDHGAYPGTMELVDALIREGKPYDLVVLPNQGHDFEGTSGIYAREAIRRYLQEHLNP